MCIEITTTTTSYMQQREQQQQQQLLLTTSALLSTASGADVSIVCQMFSDHVARYKPEQALSVAATTATYTQTYNHLHIYSPAYRYVIIDIGLNAVNQMKRRATRHKPKDNKCKPTWSDAALCDQIVPAVGLAPLTLSLTAAPKKEQQKQQQCQDFGFNFMTFYVTFSASIFGDLRAKWQRQGRGGGNRGQGARVRLHSGSMERFDFAAANNTIIASIVQYEFNESPD